MYISLQITRICISTDFKIQIQKLLNNNLRPESFEGIETQFYYTNYALAFPNYVMFTNSHGHLIVIITVLTDELINYIDQQNVFYLDHFIIYNTPLA